MVANKSRRNRVLALALPIVGGMVSQNVFNLVDMAMVGYLGDAALAAVGVGGFASFVCMAVIIGVSMGVQATASRRKGEERFSEMAVALNAGLLVVFCVAPVLSLILYERVPSLFRLLNGDPEVIALGAPYMQIRVLAITFVGCNFAFRGYWNAVDRSRLYMYTLLTMHTCNLCLNYVLIFGKLGFPELGVTGAAVGTAISTAIGTTIYVTLGIRYARREGFLRRFPSRADISQIVRLSLPNSIQTFFFAAGMTAMYWVIGKIGTLELAAANVLINITLVALLPTIGLGMAAATLVGQALGRNDPADAAQWAWDVVKIGLVLLATLGVPMWLVPDLVLSAFLHNPDTIAVARWPMRLIGMTIMIEAVGTILMNALLGAGDARRVMKISIMCQWVYFLPLAYLIGPVLGHGLFAVWLLNGSYRALMAILMATLWKQGKWAAIKV
jgi:putative MATE family efflux protein